MALHRTLTYYANKTQVHYTENAKNEKTSYDYYGNGVHGAGRVSLTTLPDLSIVYTTYNAHGLTLATWGSQTYTRWYDYDQYDQMTKLHTWQVEPTLDHNSMPASAPANSAETTWNYDAATGILLSKRDNNSKGADYEYDTANRLSKRTWARGVITSYTYTAWSELDTVTYPGDSTGTRPLDYDYDRIGRPLLVTQTGTTLHPGTNTHSFAYNGGATGNLLIDTETLTYGNSGITRVVDHHQDTYLRPDQHQLKQTGGTAEHLVDLAYKPADGRLHTVTDNTATNTGGAKTFTYAYEAAAYGLVNTVTGPVHTVDNSYEADRDILTSKENKDTVGNTVRSSYIYVTNNLGQRTNVTRGGVEMSAANGIKWTYNPRGELKEEDYGNNGTADTRDRVFSFDGIGNRKESATGTLTLTGTPNYTLDATGLNQYASVNTSGTAVSPTYDPDGNTLTGQLPAAALQGNLATLTWDAENRLVKVVDHLGNITTYEYDYVGRRIGKTLTPAGGSATPTESFIYEGWNLCAEFTGTSLKKTYTWGMDLSGSMQGAGGVGGLLMVTEHDSGNTSHYYPTYDGNGNVSEYLDSSGNVAAHYEYDAFGNTVYSSGAKAADFAHRFSTKYLDEESALYYYGYRYYDAAVGRWLSRDPIGENWETGEFNEYAFIRNDGNNWVDYLGLLGVIVGYDKNGNAVRSGSGKSIDVGQTLKKFKAGGSKNNHLRNSLARSPNLKNNRRGSSGITDVSVGDCTILILVGHGCSTKPHNIKLGKNSKAAFIGCFPGETNGAIPENQRISGAPMDRDSRARSIGPKPFHWGNAEGYGPEIINLYNNAKKDAKDLCCKCPQVKIVITSTNAESAFISEPSVFGKDIVEIYDCKTNEGTLVKGDLNYILTGKKQDE